MNDMDKELLDLILMRATVIGPKEIFEKEGGDLDGRR